MKGSKTLIGLALTLVLSACPSIASLSAAASPSGEHSCCPSDSTPKNHTQPVAPAGGDCCLRALAKVPAFLLAPHLRVVVAVLSFDQPLLKTPRLFAHGAPNLSPPREPDFVDSRSPRAPPVVPA